MQRSEYKLGTRTGLALRAIRAAEGVNILDGYHRLGGSREVDMIGDFECAAAAFNTCEKASDVEDFDTQRSTAGIDIDDE